MVILGVFYLIVMAFSVYFASVFKGNTITEKRVQTNVCNTNRRCPLSIRVMSWRQWLPCLCSERVLFKSEPKSQWRRFNYTVLKDNGFITAYGTAKLKSLSDSVEEWNFYCYWISTSPCTTDHTLRGHSTSLLERHIWKLKGSKTSWQWCITPRITRLFLWLCPSAGILKDTEFRRLYLFPSSGVRGDTYSIGSARKS